MNDNLGFLRDEMRGSPALNAARQLLGNKQKYSSMFTAICGVQQAHRVQQTCTL